MRAVPPQGHRDRGGCGVSAYKLMERAEAILADAEDELGDDHPASEQSAEARAKIRNALLILAGGVKA